MPGLTFSGPCEIMLFEGIPNKNFDCWLKIKNIEEQFDTAIQLLKEFIPYEANRCKNAELADKNAFLIGAYTPTIRRPVSKMPCGKFIMGMGDAIILNDPIAGQGANNAAKAANFYMEKIIAHGQNEFNQKWMNQIFEEYWEKDAKWSTYWTNLLLNSPEPHVVALLKAASENSNIANMLANGFDEPSTLFPWITNAEQTHQKIKLAKF